VVRHTSIIAVLALVAHFDMALEQPKGFSKPRQVHLVCKLKKSLYRMKQSPR
jgi:hypothetical protein